MNISRTEQRVLHALAQGGSIQLLRDPHGRIEAARGVTREGSAIEGCGRELFARLKRRSFIASQGGRPYRITREGLAAVRAQADNR